MKLRTILLLNALLLASTSSVTAQLRIPSLFTTVTRGDTDTRMVGNTWLGAALGASAGMSTTIGPYSQGGYESNRAYANLHGVGYVLANAAEIGYLDTKGQNIVTDGTQFRSSDTEIRILGQRWVFSPPTGSIAYLQEGYNLQLFGSDRQVVVDVGPLGVIVSGNASVSFRAGGGFQMDVLDPTIRMNVHAYMSGFANAKARVTMWLAGVAIDFRGTLGTQYLDVNGSANVSAGFSGTASYYITPITLKIVLHTWLTWADYYRTLVNSSLGVFSKRLF
ncbi:MAG: hypothetical protein H6837_11720 [Planctomycetes bacterium]|nr:hypothetical protein [Planctomycetota bacterium]